MVAGRFVAVEIGPDRHRLELPAAVLGLPAPPRYTELTLHRSKRGWTVHALAAKPNDEMVRWLRSVGAEDVRDAGREPALKATFANLPDALESPLSLLQVDRVGVGSDGSAFLSLRGPRSRVQELLVQLESRRAPENAIPLLTARQAELLQFCKDRGYYEIPRRVTLRELAKDLGISPTALSMALRRAEARILSAYVERVRHNLPGRPRKPGERAG